MTELISRSDELLDQSLKRSLKLLGLPTDFNLELRGYSKTYNGVYLVAKKTVVVYHLEEDNTLRRLDTLLKVTIHEAIHHYQYCHQEGYVRYAGVMHDTTFIRMYNFYIDKALKLNLIERSDINDYEIY